jgi:hypothetical protein
MNVTMKLRTLLSIGLIGLSPSMVLAQPEVIPPAPPVAEAPKAPRPAMVVPLPIAPTAARVPKAARPATVAIAVPPALDPAIEFGAVPPAPASPVVLPATQPPPPPAAPKAATAAVAPTAPSTPAPPRPVGQMLNVQIEVTLSDTKGTPKTVVLTVADGEMGQNRTNSSTNAGTVTSYQNFSFNADARPTIVGNKVRLYLSAETNIPASPDAKAGAAANISLRQQQTLVLNDGDSAEIARASDPVTDRNFSLSVRVKIQR